MCGHRQENGKPSLSERLKNTLLIRSETRLNQGELDDWSDEPLDTYYEHISKEYARYNSNEDEIHSRATALLAVSGVILTLMASFIVPASDNNVSLFLSIGSVLMLLLSTAFIFWAIRPANRDIVSMYSHQTDYRQYKNDNSTLKKKMLSDLLRATESLAEVYTKKVERY